MNEYLSKNFDILSSDDELFVAFESELKRQTRNIELIASENYTSPAVMAASGSILTNKYAEGYPGKRYYGGCECVDIAESSILLWSINLSHQSYKTIFNYD